MESQQEQLVHATTSTQELASLPLGSLQSRAAARLLLEQRRNSERRTDIVIVMAGIKEVSASETSLYSDGVFRRAVYLPEGITVAEGLRALGGYFEEDLTEIGETWPDPQHDFNILMIER